MLHRGGGMNMTQVFIALLWQIEKKNQRNQKTECKKNQCQSGRAESNNATGIGRNLNSWLILRNRHELRFLPYPNASGSTHGLTEGMDGVELMYWHTNRWSPSTALAWLWPRSTWEIPQNMRPDWVYCVDGAWWRNGTTWLSSKCNIMYPTNWPWPIMDHALLGHGVNR